MIFFFWQIFYNQKRSCSEFCFKTLLGAKGSSRVVASCNVQTPDDADDEEHWKDVVSHLVTLSRAAASGPGGSEKTGSMTDYTENSIFYTHINHKCFNFSFFYFYISHTVCEWTLLMQACLV